MRPRYGLGGCRNWAIWWAADPSGHEQGNGGAQADGSLEHATRGVV